MALAWNGTVLANARLLIDFSHAKDGSWFLGLVIFGGT
jgi:hypothetical protein